MAITLRTDESHDKALAKFMSKQGHATKNKAVIWLIENAELLTKSYETLNDIKEANERRAAEEKKIAKLFAQV